MSYSDDWLLTAQRLEYGYSTRIPLRVGTVDPGSVVLETEIAEKD